MTHEILRFAAAASVAAASLFFLPSAQADGGHGHGHGPDIGGPGNAADVDRTIEVTMHDNYFEPESIEIDAGETIRFVVRNEGTLVHEFNIGTAAMHAAHQEEMMMMVEHGVLMGDHIDEDAAQAMQHSMGHGMHEEANSVLLEPGEAAEIVWEFPEEADLEFACNVPGHYGAGMHGQIHLDR